MGKKAPVESPVKSPDWISCEATSGCKSPGIRIAWAGIPPELWPAACEEHRHFYQ